VKDTKQQSKIEWSKLYGRSVTDEEYKEICFNLKGFFSTLKQWDDEEKEGLKNERTNNNRNIHYSN